MFSFKGKNLHGSRGGRVTAGSTAANLPFGGTVVVFSTAASKKHFLNPPPYVGAEMTLVCRKATTTLTAWIVLPTGWSFQRTSNSTGATFRKIIQNTGNTMCSLVAISTAKIAFNAASGTTITTS